MAIDPGDNYSALEAAHAYLLTGIAEQAIIDLKTGRLQAIDRYRELRAQQAQFRKN